MNLLFSFASIVLISITMFMLAPLQHSVHDCSKWLAEENKIVAYTAYSEYKPNMPAHTYVLESGELEANELLKEEEKDDCTRALHSKIAKKDTERRRLQKDDKRTQQVQKFCEAPDCSTPVTKFCCVFTDQYGCVQVNYEQPTDSYSGCPDARGGAKLTNGYFGECKGRC